MAEADALLGSKVRLASATGSWFEGRRSWGSLTPGEPMAGPTTTDPRTRPVDPVLGSNRAERLTARIAACQPVPLAAVLGALIVLFGIMGALYVRDATFTHHGWVGSVHVGAYRVHGFNLDGERNLPAAYSGLLLVAACALGLLVAVVGRGAGIRARYVGPVALLLGYMSLDEVISIHERLEAASGVDWETLYAPVFLVAAVLAVLLLPELRPFPPAIVLFLSGGASWAVAQVIEKLQWHGDHLVAPWSIVPEEVLEMTGSLLFVLG